MINIGKVQVEQVQYGAAQKQFNLGHAVDFLFPIPPLSEQNSLVQYIKDSMMKIDHVSKRVQQEIELLQEYRSALINEVVTGKVCVL